MYITIVYVSVKSDKIDAFKQACRRNHENSVHETGNLRFDIIQSVDDPTKFVFYEAYKTKQHAVAHKETPHYLAWRDTVANWMVEPRNGVAYQGVFPQACD
ncbi:MAG: antibiotic biosynthesis monooxygenase [Nitrosomonas sp.]|nr:antibiotic biosynthesis monooxygenase [Nitrosomonas sp.]